MFPFSQKNPKKIQKFSNKGFAVKFSELLREIVQLKY